MPRVKPLPFPLPLETPSLVKQFRAIAGDPYSLFVCAWPPRKFVSCSSDAQSEMPDVEAEERLQGAERAARDEIRARVDAFAKPKKPPTQKQLDAWADRRRRLEKEAALATAFTKATDAAMIEGWDVLPRSLQEDAE